MIRRFGKKKEAPAPVVQTAEAPVFRHPFGALRNSYVLGKCERELYRSLRESIPVIDAAVYKLVRLIGSFRLKCDDPGAQAAMERFCREVPVNGLSQGLDHFVSEYFEQLLTYGTAVGEIVPGAPGEWPALYNSSLEQVVLLPGASPLQVKVCVPSPGGEPEEVPCPGLVLCSVVMAQPGEIYGRSLLRGLPFVSDILLKILQTVGTNWERIGNVRFSVTYRPGENDRGFSRERAMQIAGEWSKAMKSPEPRDFIAVGDVNIQAIGADVEMPDCQVPARLILEQIVAKLGIPPFLLGLSWSSTERMSSQQADMLTSELEYYRRVLGSMLERLGGLFLKLQGFGGTCRVEWENISLQDEVELAKAQLYRARAKACAAALPEQGGDDDGNYDGNAAPG